MSCFFKRKYNRKTVHFLVISASPEKPELGHRALRREFRQKRSASRGPFLAKVTVTFARKRLRVVIASWPTALQELVSCNCDSRTFFGERRRAFRQKSCATRGPFLATFRHNFPYVPGAFVYPPP